MEQLTSIERVFRSVGRSSSASAMDRSSLVTVPLLLLLAIVGITPSHAKWMQGGFAARPNFSLHGAARVAFDVMHQDICYDSHSEVCIEFSWSCYESTELTQSPLNRHAKVPRISRWYFLDVESDRETLRFEMRKATSMTPAARLRPFKNYTARVYSIFDEHVTLLRNFTFETIIAAPSPVQQLTVEVLNRNVMYLPRARKLNLSWHVPQDIGARGLAGYVVGLYKKPEFNFRSTNTKNLTIAEIETNFTWHIIEPINFYEKKLFVRVIPYNLLQNGSFVHGQEAVADVYLRSQYARELTVNSVGGQSVDIEIDHDIFKDVIDAGLVTNISVFVSPVEMHDHLSWKATDFSRAVVEDRMKRKQVRAVYRVSPHGWNLQNSMDKRRPEYNRFPCFQGGDRRKVVCSIGVDEKCDKLMYVQICNAPLIQNMNYTIFVRAHLKKSNYLPPHDDSKPLPVSLHSVMEKFGNQFGNQFNIGRGSHLDPMRPYNGWNDRPPNRHDGNRHVDAPGVHRFDPRYNPDTGTIDPNRFDPNSGRFGNNRPDNRRDEHGNVLIGPVNHYGPMNIPEQP